MRSEQLLRGMHKVCSHDLPNQLVALQSLLQMLQQEEDSRLSEDGREYVQRLQKVAQRTSAMARFLKEMGKLNAYVGQSEAIALSMLAREIQGTLKQQFPQAQFTFDWQFNAPVVHGDYRTFLPALIEILTFLKEQHGQACLLQAKSEEIGERIAVHFLLETTGPGNDNECHPVSGRVTLASFEQRMEVILARAWLDVSAASLEATELADGASRFTIRAPSS